MPTVMLAGPRGDWRQGCAKFLSENGSWVWTADTGLDCLTRLRAEWPDLLVLSVDLPWGGCDGVLTVMRDDPWLGQIPVVVADPRGPRPDQPPVSEPPVVQVFAEGFPPAALLDVLAAHGPGVTPADRLEILVVDDDPHVRTLLQVHLRREGFRVWVAEDGDAALNLCAERGEHIAVVLLDVHMPVLDGPHTFEGLQAYDPELPVCFMSADMTDTEMAELLRSRARHVFRKPFRLEDVARVVRGLAIEPRAAATSGSVAALPAHPLSSPL